MSDDYQAAREALPHLEATIFHHPRVTLLFHRSALDSRSIMESESRFRTGITLHGNDEYSTVTISRQRQ